MHYLYFYTKELYGNLFIIFKLVQLLCWHTSSCWHFIKAVLMIILTCKLIYVYIHIIYLCGHAHFMWTCKIRKLHVDINMLKIDTITFHVEVCILHAEKILTWISTLQFYWTLPTGKYMLESLTCMSTQSILYVNWQYTIM